MKRRPTTWGRRIELFFGAILPSLFMIPLLVIVLPYWAGTIGGMFGLHAPTVGQRVLSGFGFLLSSGWLIFVIGLAVTLWRLILYGPDQINESPRLRWFSILTLIFLLALAAWIFYEYFIRFNPFERHDPLFLGEVAVIWAVIVVGLRYLPPLLRGTKAE